MKSRIISAAVAALLLSASFSSAWANYYLIGAFNEWNDDTKVPFTETDGVYTLTQEIEGQFKIKDDNNNWYGAYSDGCYEFNSVNPSATLVTDYTPNLLVPFKLTYTFTIEDGVLTVSGFKYFISGDFNSWAAEEMTLADDGTYRIEKNVVAGQQFKIRDYNTNDSHWFGGKTGSSNPYEVKNDWCSNIPLTQGGDGQNFIINTDGTYTFILTADRHLTVLGFNTLLTLSDTQDNIGTLGSCDTNQAYDVVIDGRTFFKDGYWNTFCLPFSIEDFHGTIFEEADVETLSSTSYSDGTLTMNFSFERSIEAGKPYIVKWSSKKDDIVNPTFTNVKITPYLPGQVETNAANFVGVYGPETINGEDYLYLGAKNTLYYPENVTINAFRGYFELNLEEGGSQPIKAFQLNFGDETTGIKEISNPSNSSNLSNLSNLSNSFFTLDGRRVNGMPRTSGLFIINGVKVLIK